VRNRERQGRFGRWGAWVAAVVGGLMAVGCAPKPVEIVETRAAMDTLVTMRVVAPSEAQARVALDAAWKEMELGIAKLDWHRAPSEAWLRQEPQAMGDPTQQPSDVWLINRNAGQFAITVDPIVTGCLDAARDVYDLSDGAFDPTVLPLLDVWREAAKRGTLPTDEEIAKARALVGLAGVDIIVSIEKPSPMMNPSTQSKPPTNLVLLPKEGMRIDLGGIAKGYIVGRMVSRLRQHGIQVALVEAGGDLYALGERPESVVASGEDRRWGVGVQDPRYPDDPTHLYTALHVRDAAVVTSGHYERGYTVAGQRFSHIIDPRTGRPVDTRLASVTIVAPDAGIADGLATAVEVMGVEKGKAFLDNLTNVEYLLLERSPEAGAPAGAEVPLTAYRSSGFSALEYKLEAPKAAKAQ